MGLQRLQQKLKNLLGFEWSKVQSIPLLHCCSEHDLSRAGFSGTHTCATGTLNCRSLSNWLLSALLLNSCGICCKSLFQQFWMGACILKRSRTLLSLTVSKVAFVTAGLHQYSAVSLSFVNTLAKAQRTHESTCCLERNRISSSYI